MGCDIHMFAEFRAGEERGWRNFGQQFRLPRDYALFGILAGVRWLEAPMVAAPRGFPHDAGWRTRDEYTVLVTPTQEDANRWRVYGEQADSRERAEEWIGYGSSEWLEGPYDPPRHGLVGRISDPDAHTPSWLTLAEFREAIRRRTEPPGGVWPECRDLLAALEALERDGHECRVVFWFDN